MAWCWVFLVTLRATEWFIKVAGSFMYIQMAWRWAFVVTIPLVNSSMLLQMNWFRKFAVALGASEGFSLQWRFFHASLAWISAFVVTDRAAKWFVTSMSYFMFLQATWCSVLGYFMCLRMAWCWASVVTLQATEWFITSVICEFIHSSSNLISSSWRVFSYCGFFQGS